ncbi:uncharacterized protein VP01_2821g1 [Puccinia sorghi]|uniref:CCHC-type domain-containing protein n=1 Tax=Puccinia sorghi TaxID=27349 RepID=A0A0L6V2B4_9BASI|nr:uncharacterized protein VP01_2821g1 [Puccinia sorghi]
MTTGIMLRRMTGDSGVGLVAGRRGKGKVGWPAVSGSSGTCPLGQNSIFPIFKTICGEVEPDKTPPTTYLGEGAGHNSNRRDTRGIQLPGTHHQQACRGTVERGMAPLGPASCHGPIGYQLRRDQGNLLAVQKANLEEKTRVTTIVAAVQTQWEYILRLHASERFGNGDFFSPEEGVLTSSSEEKISQGIINSSPLTRKLTFLWRQMINKRRPQDHQEIEVNAVGKQPICYICKKPDHVAPNCPQKRGNSPGQPTVSRPTQHFQNYPPCSITYNYNRPPYIRPLQPGVAQQSSLQVAKPSPPPAKHASVETRLVDANLFAKDVDKNYVFEN